MPDIKELPYFVVMAPENDPPEVKVYWTQGELVDYLKGFKPDGQVAIYIFQGYRLKFTKGPFRYLIPAQGDPIPLFDPPAYNEETAEDGFWFEEEDIPVDPVKPKPKAKAKPKSGGKVTDFPPMPDEDDNGSGGWN